MSNYLIDNIEKGYIKPSKLHGLGLFAFEKIEKSETLGLLNGQSVPWSYVKDFAVDSEWNALTSEQVLYRPFKTKYYFINHSRTPNLKLKVKSTGFIEIIALELIEKDQELLLDYRQENLPEWYLSGHGSTYL